LCDILPDARFEAVLRLEACIAAESCEVEVGIVLETAMFS
jgi:hypothetical protein